MPKKHRQPTFRIKPQSTAPHSIRSPAPERTSHHGGIEEAEDDSPSVNELLTRQRFEAASISQFQAAQYSNRSQISRSVPPSLREVLDLPEVTSPKPRRLNPQPGLRMRRIPGPPPPQSWLDTNHSSTREQHASRTAPSDNALERQCMSQASISLPHKGSLAYMCLKGLVQTWSDKSEDEKQDYVMLYPHLKEALLSFAGICETHSPAAQMLQYLFPSSDQVCDDPNRSTDREQELSFDLNNTINSTFSMKQVGRKLVTRARPTTVFRQCQEREDDMIDSWDSIPEAHQIALSSPGVPVRSIRPRLIFPSLKSLSLAIRPENSQYASWAELLEIVDALATLESLSLAWWPKPSYVRYFHQTSSIRRGPASVSPMNRMFALIPDASGVRGTDQEWEEATRILRTLSRSLYCLKKLNVTGCYPWLAAADEGMCMTRASYLLSKSELYFGPTYILRGQHEPKLTRSVNRAISMTTNLAAPSHQKPPIGTIFPSRMSTETQHSRAIYIAVMTLPPTPPNPSVPPCGTPTGRRLIRLCSTFPKVLPRTHNYTQAIRHTSRF